MGFDLSGIDAELGGLGSVPRDLEARSAEQTRALGTLQEIDASLAALEAGLSQPVVMPQRSPVPRANVNANTSRSFKVDGRRPESGEIDLGAPVQRRAEPASTELTLLDSDRPSSGSFELSDDTSVEAQQPDPFASPRRPAQADVNPISLSPGGAGSRAPELEITPFSVDPIPQRRHSAPLLFVEELQEPDTIVQLEDRDADAEFDALFDEATHPSGIPTRNLDNDDEGLSADDLLSGLSAPSMRAGDTTGDSLFSESESDIATRALFSDLDASDNTDIIDANTLAAHLDPFPADEELGSSEFEIVLDDDGEAKDLVPSQPPELGANASGPDKRPSFLGRLFGRKDDKV